jgi:hypothetical protein
MYLLHVWMLKLRDLIVTVTDSVGMQAQVQNWLSRNEAELSVFSEKYRKSVINLANETVENMLTLLEAMPESAPSASTRIRLYDHDGLVELEVHIEVLRKTTITE